MADSALYYPFTSPRSDSFYKNALFLWDSLELIVPETTNYPRGQSRSQNAALEVIGRAYVPTQSEKQLAHKEFEQLLEKGIPEGLLFDLEHASERYPSEIDMGKMLLETWEMLCSSNLADVVYEAGRTSRARVKPLLGYYMMAVLASCCAREGVRLVTDDYDPYRTLATALVDMEPPTHQSEDWHGRLIALSMPGPDLSESSIDDLVQLRKKEDKLMQELRRNFRASVERASSEITQNSDNPNVVSSIIRDFTDSTEKDLLELKRALRRSGSSVILSKEFAISVLAFTASLTVEPVSGALVTIGGLTKALGEYQDRRRKILREHPSAWLISGGPSRYRIA